MLLMIITLEGGGGEIGMKEKLSDRYIHSDTFFCNVMIYGWVDTMVVGI